MKIDRIKISGVAPDVLGFAFAPLSVSWRVVDPEAEAVTETLIELSRDPSFLTVDYAKRGKLSAAGEPLDCAVLPRTRYYLRLTVTTDDETTAVGTPVSFETGKRNEPYGGAWIAPAEGDDCHPVFLRRFRITKPVSRARAYLFAAGVYEVRLDGVKCGDEYLAPYFNDYRFALQVSTYALDLTPGAHTLAVAVGRGWYRGRFGLDGGRENTWGDRSALIGEVHIDYTDGSREVLLTDGAWVYAPDDTTLSGIYDGEDVDRTRFSEGRPEKPVECLSDGGNLMRGHLTDRFSPPLRVVETFPVREVISTPRGETVLDFGQNFAGFVRFRCRAPRGTKVTLDFGEVLQDGCFYNDNYRTARARFTFVAGGDEEWVEPRFTYCGFRYVRVTGQENPEPADFLGCALSSEMDDTLDFKTGHRGINRLLENVRWGMRSNFVDMPTDCPQRDERLGWTGDAQVFVRTASLNFDVERFFKKWLHDLAADQGRDGCVPHVIPNIFDDMGGSSAWSDAAVICPWEIYRTYGDKAVLEEQFDSMKAWIDWMRERSENGRRSGGSHFGDWLGLDSPEGSYKGATSEDLIATAYYKYSTELFIKAAHALGRDVAEYENIPAEAAKAFRREYMENGRVKNATQTACVLALYFDITDDRAATAGQLNELIERAGHLETGFVGTPYLLHALSENGYKKTAYDLLLRREYPSWLYPISKGATTVWEHWDGIKPDGTMWSADMNSFNHYAYGAVADWMYGAAAGINADPERPGFEHIIFRPVTDERLNFVRASIDTRRGTVKSEWRRENGGIRYIFTVPEGSTASVIIGEETHDVGAGVHEIFE